MATSHDIISKAMTQRPEVGCTHDLATYAKNLITDFTQNPQTRVLLHATCPVRWCHSFR